MELKFDLTRTSDSKVKWSYFPPTFEEFKRLSENPVKLKALLSQSIPASKIGVTKTSLKIEGQRGRLLKLGVVDVQ